MAVAPLYHRVDFDRTIDDDDGEPGALIVYADAADVHAALALPAVAAIAPPKYAILQQGATPAASLANLRSWVDNLAVLFSGPGVLVRDINNFRQPGVFHQMKTHELQALESTLSSVNVWSAQCVANNISCGKYYSIVPGGRRGLVILQVVVGPFV